MQGFVTVETSLGKLRGFEHAGITSFLGVRYAEAPVGDLRFKPAVYKKSWHGTEEALSFGPVSMQPDTRVGAQTEERMEIMRKMYPKGGNPLEGNHMSEDSLFLNVWSSNVNPSTLKPVMVWLHGGGFVQGAGSIGLYEGDNLAKLGDVVVVTLNHRLGIWGFMPLELAPGDEFAGSANAGMTDIVMALRWVKHNIASMGGDPNNVTIFGQSGGGVKVSTLMAMPSARGLFHKGISMSGPGIRANTAETAANLRERVFSAAATRKPKEIQNLTRAQIVELAETLSKSDGNMLSTDPQPTMGGLMAFAPSIDALLPEHPFDPAPNSANDMIPMIAGYTTHDPSFLLVDDPNYKGFRFDQVEVWADKLCGAKGPVVFAEYKSRFPDENPQRLMSRILSDALFGVSEVLIAERKSLQSAPVYAYEFAYETDVYPELLGASHSMDLAFVFNNVGRSPFAGTKADRFEVAKNMALAFARFAHTGDPSHAGIPTWPQFNLKTRATMVIDSSFSVKSGNPSSEMPQITLGG